MAYDATKTLPEVNPFTNIHVSIGHFYTAWPRNLNKRILCVSVDMFKTYIFDYTLVAFQYMTYNIHTSPLSHDEEINAGIRSIHKSAFCVKYKTYEEFQRAYIDMSQWHQKENIKNFSDQEFFEEYHRRTKAMIKMAA